MISWAGRESLTISDFSSLTCDQADLRFSRFLWEAWSKVIFATSNVNRNRFHCLIECHINTIIMRNRKGILFYIILLSYKLGKTAESLQASYLAISSACGYLMTLCILWVARVRVENYGKSSVNYTNGRMCNHSYWCNEFPLSCGIAEESLMYDNFLNNKRISSTYVTCLFFWKTHILSSFKMEV